MLFDLRNVSLRYDGFPALADVTCRIEPSSLVLLRGSTGAGKTSFLRLLYASLLPSEGKVFVNGSDTRSLRGRSLRALRRSLGIVRQPVTFVPHLPVLENILFPLAVLGIGKKGAIGKALEVMASLEISHVRGRLPSTLSAGERSLAALARAIVTDPASLIVDEPTANLDAPAAHLVARVLAESAAKGATVVVATHSASMAEQCPGSRVLFLHDGVLTEEEHQIYHPPVAS